MSFLSPWLLLGMLGVGIPLAIHLIRKRKANKVVFSTLRFLRKTPKKMIFFQEVQQWLLLAVRTLIFILLALAFARPFFGKLPESIGLSPQSVVILLDTSMSMHYADHFEQAKAEAANILRSLQPGDEAALVTFSDSTQRFKSLTRDLDDLERTLARLEAPSHRTTHYLPALRFADQILRSARYPERTVYLVSDFQSHGLENVNERWQLSRGVELKTAKVGQEATTNLAVTDVKSPTQVLPHQEDYTVLGRIRSLGSRHVSRAQVSLEINGAVVETREVDLSDKSEAIVAFQVPFDAQQGAFGSISVEDAVFPADNTFHFTVNVPAPVKILAINGEPSTNWYDDESHWFRLALGQDSDSSFQLEIREPSQLDPPAFDAYQIIALLNVGSLPLPQRNALQSYVQRGGAVLFALGDQINAEGFNRLFEGLLPAFLKRAHAHDSDSLVLADTHPRHPIFQFLQATDTPDFSTATFSGYWEVVPREGSEILMRFDNGSPAFIEKAIGGGNAMLFASSLDAEWNNLPLQVMYLPLLHETMRYLAEDEEKQSFYEVGESVALRLPPRTLVHVVEPQGEKTELTPQAGERHFYNKTEHPGLYRLEGNTFREHFAVNVAAEESNLLTMSPQALQERVSNPETQTSTPLALQATFYQQQLEKSQNVWWWILLLVFVLGVAESFLANRTYR